MNTLAPVGFPPPVHGNRCPECSCHDSRPVCTPGGTTQANPGVFRPVTFANNVRFASGNRLLAGPTRGARNVSSPSQRRLPGGQRWVHTVGKEVDPRMLWTMIAGSRRGVCCLLAECRRCEIGRACCGCPRLPDPAGATGATGRGDAAVGGDRARRRGPDRGLAPRIAAAVATVLFTGFCVGLTVNLLRGRRELDCGCFAFGNEGEAAADRLVPRGAGATLAVVAGRSRYDVDVPRKPAEHVLAVAGVLVAGRNRRGRATALGGPPRPGPRPLDAHLSKASIELRVASAISRY